MTTFTRKAEFCISGIKRGIDMPQCRIHSTYKQCCRFLLVLEIKRPDPFRLFQNAHLENCGDNEGFCLVCQKRRLQRNKTP